MSTSEKRIADALRQAEKVMDDLGARVRRYVSRVALVTATFIAIQFVGVWALLQTAVAADRAWALYLVIGGAVGLSAAAVEIARWRGLAKGWR